MDDPMNENPESVQVRLTRLADASVSARERARLLAEVERSPERAAELAEQQRAVGLIRSIDVSAPERLRHRTETMMRPARDRRRLLRPRLTIVPAAGALAAVIVALVVILSLRTTVPTVAQAAQLALSPATLPAPAANPSNPDLLALRVDGVAYPNYIRTVGWEASGARRDELHGRDVTTVVYTNPRGDRVGYSIVSGAALTPPAGTLRVVSGVSFVLARSGPGTLITWRRAGHTCIIAGRGTSPATLLALAIADERVA